MRVPVRLPSMADEYVECLCALAAGEHAQGVLDVFDDEMLTIEDVAAYLKLKPQTIYKWAQTGKIPGAKFGKEWRFRRSAIERWIDRQISSQTGAPEEDLMSKGGASADGTGRVKLTARDSEKLESSASKSGASKSSKTSRASKDGTGPEKN